MAQTTLSFDNPAVRPFTNFRFAVEVQLDGVSEEICAAAFSEVDGLELAMEPKTFQEGGQNNGPVHLVGPMKSGQLTLKRGMTGSFDLWKWFARVVSPGYRGVRPTAEVVVFSPDGRDELVRFILEGVLPTRIKAPALNAREGAIAIEEMQLVYQRLRLRAPADAAGGTGP